MWHHEITEVRLFGSRAKGVHQKHSDVDLAVFGGLSPLEAQAVAAELDDLPLPYRFDVQAFECINDQPLREHIERAGVRLYPLDSSDTGDSFESVFRDAVEGRMDFWTSVENLSRRDLTALIRFGLARTSGSYKELAELLHIGVEDYRGWMDFLRRKNCVVDPKPFAR